MNHAAPVILWFRHDLRLADNPALAKAVETGAPFVGLFVLDDVSPGERAYGGAARWWLHQSLKALQEDIEKRGGRLFFEKGDAREIVPRLAARLGAGAVFWNRLYEDWAQTRDAAIKSALREDGRRTESFNASLLIEPWRVTTKTGDPYKVFTPYWKAIRGSVEPDEARAAPDKLRAFEGEIDGPSLDDVDLEPRVDWAKDMRGFWEPGEAGAKARLDAFLKGPVEDYADARDFPGRDGTSRLSPHLRWGEIAPGRIWRALSTRIAQGGDVGRYESFLSELGWREFSYHLLHHFPAITQTSFKPNFERFPWREDDDALEQWRHGRTGYPLVDAGMRQLWSLGWMHNRVRMVVGSFLVKHLLIDWRAGERWFWDTLVDADPASNVAGWQWVAGSGADAAPYFRIFNPTTQAEKFDGKADYVRQWVPELARLPAKAIHAPWLADETVLKEAGVRLGTDYPEPIVDHKRARERALSAYDAVKAS